MRHSTKYYSPLFWAQTVGGILIIQSMEIAKKIPIRRLWLFGTTTMTNWQIFKSTARLISNNLSFLLLQLISSVSIGTGVKEDRLLSVDNSNPNVYGCNPGKFQYILPRYSGHCLLYFVIITDSSGLSLLG